MTPPVSGGVPEQGLRELVVEVDRAVNAWIGCEAPRVETGGPYWHAMEIARARLRAALERPRPALPPEPTDREIGLRSALNAALVDLRIFRGADDHFVQALEQLVAQTGGAALPAPAEPPPITTAMLAAALDDVFETTQWEGKGASIAPGLYAALKSQLGATLPAEHAPPEPTTTFRIGDVFEIPAPEVPVPWSIDPEGTRAVRTVTNGTYRYTFFGDDAPENAAAVRDALNAVAREKKP